MANSFLETRTFNPWWNLAVEKYLSEQIREGDVWLYLWQNDHTVVIGRNQNALRECRAKLLEEDGGYLARRTTGGGAVYHDLGNLCFTFLASPEVYDLTRQMSVIQCACRDFGIETQFSGRNVVITEDGCKFSGNAFSKTKQCWIQHGTLMVDVDVTQLGKYLTPSREKLKSKGVESVRSRVCNLKELNPEVSTDAMRAALKESFREIYGEFKELDAASLDCPEVRETYGLYSSWEWRYGKSPACETSAQKRFDWGEIEIFLKLQNLRISEATVYSDMLDVDFPGLFGQFLVGKRYDMADADVEKGLPGCPEEQRQKAREIVDWLAGMND